ncbi:MAG: DUF2523 family protein [Sulfuricellaceae bacterium]
MDYLQGIYDFISSVPDFFIAIFEFLNSGIVDFFISLGQYIMDSLECLFLKIVLLILNFSWAIIRVLLVDLNISGRLSIAFSSFNSDIFRMLLFFRIPEALSMILGAFVTRFVLRMIPFL